MQTLVDNLAILLPILLGSGDLGALVTWKYQGKKASAEAMKEVQDVYQQTIADLKEEKERIKTDAIAEREELKKEIANLKERLDKQEEEGTRIKEQIQRNLRIVRGLLPITCTNTECKKRQLAALQDSDLEPSEESKSNKPYCRIPESPEKEGV